MPSLSAGPRAGDPPSGCRRLLGRGGWALTPILPTLARMGESAVPARPSAAAAARPDPRPEDAVLLEAGRLATIGTLTRTVAHEINNPLLAILGLVEFLRSDLEEGTEPHAFVELIHQNGLEIKRVVRAVLEFTREPAYEWGPVSLSRIAAETVELARGVSPIACAAIVENYAAGETPVRGNGNQLKQVLLHLIRHGERTMLDGGTVTLTTSRDTDSVSAVVSYECASRHTMESPPLERAEFQAGLAVSQAIARAHGGQLELRARASGKDFVLGLPTPHEGR